MFQGWLWRKSWDGISHVAQEAESQFQKGGHPFFGVNSPFVTSWGSDFNVHGLISGFSLQTSLPAVGTLEPRRPRGSETLCSLEFAVTGPSKCAGGYLGSSMPPLTRMFLLEQMFI